jgi:hypothetical protein
MKATRIAIERRFYRLGTSVVEQAFTLTDRAMASPEGVLSEMGFDTH